MRARPRNSCSRPATASRISVLARVSRESCPAGGVASRTLPLARDDSDFDVAPLDDADLDDEDFDAAVFDVAGFARDEAEPFDEPDRLAGVLFLDDPQLDMSPPPYQPGVTPAGPCYPASPVGPVTDLRGVGSDGFDALDGAVGADDDVEQATCVRAGRHHVAHGAVGTALDADRLDDGRRQLVGDAAEQHRLVETPAPRP